MLFRSFVGGLLGSFARGGAEWACAAMGGPAWASRVVVNVLGAFAIGCVFARLAARDADGTPLGIPHDRRMREHLVCGGFLGGFTTVSGMAWDVAQATSAGDARALALVIAANAVVGVAAAALGWRVGRK